MNGRVGMLSRKIKANRVFTIEEGVDVFSHRVRMSSRSLISDVESSFHMRDGRVF